MVVLSSRGEDFAMFDSEINHKDLIFQDATVRLAPIDPANQNYKDFLGPDFIRSMQRMESIDCVTGSGKEPLHHLSVVVMVTCSVLSIMWQLMTAS